MRTTDVVSASEQSAINWARVFLFFTPLTIGATIIMVTLHSELHIIIQAAIILLALPLVLLALGFLCLDLGQVQSQRGNYAVAETLLRCAIVLMRTFKIGPIRNFHALPTSILAELLVLRGKYNEAELFYEKNAKMCQQGRDGKDLLHGPYLVVMLKDIAICRYKAGQYNEAFASISKAVIMVTHEFYEDVPTVGMPAEQDRLDAVELANLSKLLLRNIQTDDVVFSARARTVLFAGAILRAMDHAEAGHQLVSEVIKLFIEHYGPDDPEMFDPYFEYALAARDVKDNANAREMFDRAATIARQNYNRRHPNFKRLEQVRASFA